MTTKNTTKTTPHIVQVEAEKIKFPIDWHTIPQENLEQVDTHMYDLLSFADRHYHEGMNRNELIEIITAANPLQLTNPKFYRRKITEFEASVANNFSPTSPALYIVHEDEKTRSYYPHEFANYLNT